MASLNGFDANSVEPTSKFGPIPAADYNAIIVASEIKRTKAGTGSYLQLTFQIISGTYENRRLWSRLNLENPSSEAVKIGKADLSAICRAVGVLQPEDSNELHDKPLTIAVRCKPRSDTGELANEIVGWSEAKSLLSPESRPERSYEPTDDAEELPF